MVGKIFKIKFERDMIESLIFTQLRIEAPYLSGGEAQRLSRIIANKYKEMKEQIEESKNFINSHDRKDGN